MDFDDDGPRVLAPPQAPMPHQERRGRRGLSTSPDVAAAAVKAPPPSHDLFYDAGSSASLGSSNTSMIPPPLPGHAPDDHPERSLAAQQARRDSPDVYCMTRAEGASVDSAPGFIQAVGRPAVPLSTAAVAAAGTPAESIALASRAAINAAVLRPPPPTSAGMPRSVGTRDAAGDAVVYRLDGTQHELRLSRPPARPASAGLPTFKVVMLGDCSVGKSSLQRRLVHNAFDAFCEPTVGVDYVARTVELFDRPQPAAPSVPSTATAPACGSADAPVPDGSAQPHTEITDAEAVAPLTAAVLQLWDTAGQERNFNALSSAFLRGALGAVLCYDVTRRSSLHNLGGWMARARTLLDPDAVVAVVGTKSDLKHDIEVTEEEGEAFAHALGCRHFVSSSYTGDGVPCVFFQLLLGIGAMWQARGCANVTCGELAATAVRPSLRSIRGGTTGSSAGTGGGGSGSVKNRACCN